MRVRLNQEGPYGASNTMTLALVTLYGETDTVRGYRANRNRFTAFLAECVAQTPPDCPSQQRIRELCPVAKRVKLYVSEWGMTEPSHYVILHRVTTPGLPDIFKLGCARLLRCLSNLDSMIDGVHITWPSNNPEVACGQTALLMRQHMSGASVSVDMEASPELQQELLLSVETMHLFNSQDVVSVWGHPGKTVFEVTPNGVISLVRVRPHAPNVVKFNVVLWGDVAGNVLPDARDMPRHIVPQIKGAEEYMPLDSVETNMLRWALESRLLPYIAISHTTQRGDIFCLSYDPEADDCIVTRVAENHKIVGLPKVLRVVGNGEDVYVPDLALADRLKTLFLKGTHTETIRRLLRTMGYKNWEHLRVAFENWGLPLTLEEEDRMSIIKSEL